MKQYIILFISSLILLPINAQVKYHQDESYTFDAEKDGWHIYEAKNNITLKPGFSYTASAKESFTGKVNNKILFPNMSNAYKKENGDLTDKASEGYAVGAIPGTFNVSATGAATYTIPIEVPSGVNGMQPNIALSYNSQAGNGIAGWGWNISGMSAITSTNRTVYYDDVVRGIEWRYGDALTLDGNRLIVVDDSNCRDSVVYRTEIDNGLHIVGYGVKMITSVQTPTRSTRGQPTYFIVRTKDGKTITFGGSNNSRQRNEYATYSWHVTRIEDKYQNYVAYNYNYTEYSVNSLRFDFRINEITYGHMSSVVGKIKFNYSNTRTVKQEGYIAGFENSNQCLLDNIQVFSGTEQLRKYTLKYESESDNLSSIISEALGNTKQELSFENSVIKPKYTDCKIKLIDSNYFPLYAGGELRNDISALQIYNSGSFTLKSGSGNITYSVDDLKNYFYVDLNGDYISEGVYIVEDQTNSERLVYYVVDENLNIKNTFGGANVSNDYILGDFTGNGTIDILVKSSKDIFVMNEYYSGLPLDLSKLDQIPNDATFTSGDMNGDGKDEIIVKYNKTIKIYEINHTNRNLKQLYSETAFTSTSNDIAVGDYNGDGIQDIFKRDGDSFSILFSTGTDFIERTQDISPKRRLTNENSSVVSYDVNKDGYSEVLLVHKGTKINGKDDSQQITLFMNRASEDDTEVFEEINLLSLIPSSEKRYDFFSLVDSDNDGRLEVAVINMVGDYYESIVTTPLFFTNILYNKHVTSIHNGFTNVDVEYFQWYGYGRYGHIYNYTDKGIKTKTYGYNPLFAKNYGMRFLGYDVFKIGSIYGFSVQENYLLDEYPSLICDNVKYRTTNHSDFSDINMGLHFYDSPDYAVSYESKVVKPYGDACKVIKLINESTVERDYVNKNGRKFVYTYKDDWGCVKKIDRAYYDDGVLIDTISQTTELIYPNNDNWLDNFPIQVNTTQVQGNDTIVRTIDNEYYPTGKLKREVRDSTSLFQNNIVYTYDEYGNPETITISAPNDVERTELQVTELAYTDDGRFVESKTTQGLTSSYTYDLTRGLVTSATAPSGLTTRYFYDALGRKYKTRLYNGVESYTTLNWVPSGDDDSPEDALYYACSQTSGIAPGKTYYNKNGQVLRTVAQGFSNSQVIYTDMEYYEDGRIKSESLPYLSGTAEADIQWTSYYYDDDFNRLSKVVYADGSEMHKDYIDAERKVATTIINTVDGVTKTQSDTVMSNALGQTIASTDNMDNTVSYGYDAAGRLKNLFVDENYVTSFEYDLLGNRTQIDDPDAGIITSNYNAFGQLMSSTNARNQTTSYLYDALGKVYQEETKDATNNSLDKLEYDYITSGSAIGQLHSVKQNNILAEEYSYDNMGRMNGKTEYIEGHATPFTHSHTYDDYGRIKTQTYPGGFTTLNKYNAQGDLSKIFHVGEVLSVIYENTDLNTFGALTKYKIGNNSVTREYDKIGRLTYQGCGNLQSMNYDYDEMGNLKYREDDISEQREDFVYDDLNRLSGINYSLQGIPISSAGKTITYDATGNILSKTDVGADMVYGENGKPHALTSINSPGSYQPSDQDITYTYFNKAKKITQDVYSYEYTYGIDHQRRKTTYKKGNTTLRTKYYLGNYEKVIENGITKEYNYLSADAGTFAIFVTNSSGKDSLFYVLTDYLGSLTKVIYAKDNSLYKSISYGAWGNLRNANDWESGLTTNSAFADRGFTGHEYIPSVFGLIDMNGRMYDPVIGRFLSPDPYVQMPYFSQSLNRYSYCLNNPLLFTDPSGYTWKVFKPFEKAWNWAWDKADQFANWADNTNWFPSSANMTIRMNSNMEVEKYAEIGGVPVYNSEAYKQYKADKLNDKIVSQKYDDATTYMKTYNELDKNAPSKGDGLSPTKILRTIEHSFRLPYTEITTYYDKTIKKGNFGSITVNSNNITIGISTPLKHGTLGISGNTIYYGSNNIQIGTDLKGTYSINYENSNGIGYTIDFNFKSFSENLSKALAITALAPSGYAIPSFIYLY